MPVLVGMEGESTNLLAEANAIKNRPGNLTYENVSPLETGKADHYCDQAQGLMPPTQESGTRPKRAYRQKVIPAAETGRPETSKEFAARVAKHFVLNGPQQRKEGEVDTQKLTIRIPARKQSDDLEQARDKEISERSKKLHKLTEPLNPVSLAEMMAGGREPIDLLNSISARIKQTRNANRKRTAIPFKEGEFVYVSTKNMTFPKGLACKLISKFVGPYLLLKDYGNHSFRIQLPSHMLQRGIHDVFHASLLRIHHPNDDRRFPGRLYSQVVSETEPEHNVEWAADKIVNHAGSKKQAIFEVLWRAGDITWLPYDQVKELDLLAPYLDAQNASNISELTPGTGKPPVDDPQVFLGSLQLESTYINPLNTTQQHLSLHPIYSEPLSLLFVEITPPSHLQSMDTAAATISCPTNANFRPKSHYKPHPLLGMHPDGFLQLAADDPNLTIHPAQLLHFLDHDSNIRRRHPTINTGDNPCEFAMRDPETGTYNINNYSIPRSILTFPFFNNRYLELRSFNVIDGNGDVNEDGWANVKNALLRPHRDAVRNQARSESRKAEKKFKKRRLKEAKSEGFKPISASGLSKKGRGVNRSNDPVDKMPVDQFIQQTTLSE
ncbi:hypothetical protein E4T56_gene4945 [Termitomyces sp. T112]|nr:hypothetical protein E4T56_gene4945 [Termitomyces sp. T112]